MAFSFHPIFFEKVKILLDTLNQAKINYIILSGYRDYHTQKKMYESGSKGFAHPDTSFHVMDNVLGLNTSQIYAAYYL